MNIRHIAFAGLIAIIVIVYFIANTSTFLGPYGTPGDNLHLLILIATLFIAFLAYIFVTRGRHR